MTYTLVFSDTAIDTFESIKSQINDRWGTQQVMVFETRTLEVLDLIKSSPLIFQSIKIDNNIRKAVIHRNCSVFYEVREQTIEVLYFWDNRQAPLFV